MFLKEDIHRFIPSTEPFLSDIRGLRYTGLRKVNFFVGHPVLSRHPPDTLQISSRHSLDTHQAPSKFQLPSFHRSKTNYDRGGWLVSRTFFSHVVVQLASLQDFKQSLNSQVRPSVLISAICNTGNLQHVQYATCAI